MMFTKPSRNLKATAAAASLLALLAGAPAAALACNQDAYIGAICTTAANYCPQGMLIAQGQTLSISQYTALFSLLGTTYGGDGRNTFGLPDLRGRVTVGAGQSPGLSNVALGQKRGVEGVSLSANQMAPHTHTALFTGTGGGAGGSGTASGTISLPVTGSSSSAAVTGTVTANVLTTQNAVTGAISTPSNTNNAAGKIGSTPAYYPYAAGSAVNSPTTISLTAAGAPVTGTASGPVSLPVSGGGITGGTVAVANNVTTNLPVPVLNPGLGMTVCIVATGLFPPHD